MPRFLDDLRAALKDGSKGRKPVLARHVAEELTAHDPLAAHAEAELGIHLG